MRILRHDSCERDSCEYLLMFIKIDKTSLCVYYYIHKEMLFMAKKSIILLPETINILSQMGLQIKYARLRRKLKSELVAERAGISRATLVAIEKGSPSVAIGCYAAVLHALNYMDKDLMLVAKDDELGRKLQDLDLPVRMRATKKGKSDE